MKIKIFRKQYLLSLIGILISLLTAYIFIINSKWLLLVFNILLIAVLVTIMIGYYQVVVFEENKITLITNFKKKRNISYDNITFAYIATITIKNRKMAKWIILCEKGKENNSINYRELLLPIKENMFVNFRYSKKRELLIDKFFKEKKKVVINNYTGNIRIKS